MSASSQVWDTHLHVHIGMAVMCLLLSAMAGAALVLVTQTLAGGKWKRRREQREARSATNAKLSGSATIGDKLTPEAVPKRTNSPGYGSRKDRSPSPTTPSLQPQLNLARINQSVVKTKSAEDCIKWAFEEFRDGLVMSTSFGMQSAVLLHMATRVVAQIPVIWIDTGYLHRETYLFARHLAKRLNLNLRVYQSDLSPARMEALHGQLWNNDDEASHRVYGVLRKVAPMNRALRDMGACALLSGVRKAQTDHRSTLERVMYHEAQHHYRIHPLLHWSKSDIDDYIATHKLPYHPLKRKGYVSVGDAHSTKPITQTASSEKDERLTRFEGKHQECGLHTERAGAFELDAILRRFAEAGLNAPPPPHSSSSSPQALASVPPPLQRTASDDEFLSSYSGPDTFEERPLHGSNQGIEIYGRGSCKFCDAACRILQSRNIPFTWCIMQRFNHETGCLVPCEADGINVVSRADVERRIEAVAPGFPPIETVPQIFKDGEYVGGFTELCRELDVPKSVMDVALLQIGGELKYHHGWAHTWNVQASLRRGPPLLSVFKADDDAGVKNAIPANKTHGKNGHCTVRNGVENGKTVESPLLARKVI